MSNWGLPFVFISCILCFSFGVQAASTSWQTWGPYRPNLYFGVRPQVPESMLMGLMWANGSDEQTMLKSIRDTCEQDDGMDGYGWTTYDTRVGGSQAIHDKELYVDLSTEFIKTEEGDNWAVRVVGKLRPDAPSNVKTTIIFHTAVEGSNTITCGGGNKALKKRADAEVKCQGDVSGIGAFSFQVVGDAGNTVQQSTAVKSVQVSQDKIWQAKSVFQDQYKASKSSQEAQGGAGNMHFIQTTFEGAFTTTFTYQASASDSLDAGAVEKRLNTLRWSFPTDVDKVFPRDALFQETKYAEFSQTLLSNLLGGMGFFHGDSKVDDSHAPEYEETEPNFWEKAADAMTRANITTTKPTSLLSFTPSRPFFPRGFLWDEGFHLLPVIEWDLDLAVSVLQSWLGLMDEDGWIGREQILGPEARSKVPEKFQTQYPHYANPPTLSLLFPILVSKLTNPSTYLGHPSTYMASKDKATTMLKELYPLLARHYQWFRRTQAGDFSSQYPRPEGAVKGEGYRWRGRTPDHTLTSGLDDYPRASPPHPSELHVDALAWVGASAQALQKVAKYLGEDADASSYEKQVKDVKHNLDTLHWDVTEKAYCDSVAQSETNGGPLVYKHACHLGYMSLFPLVLGLLDAKHTNLPSVLDLVSDTSKLWSNYGIRSLSAQDPNYGTEEDYWRGAVWMQLNVLAVLRLQDLGVEGQDAGNEPTSIQTRALSLAGKLRQNVVSTVYNSWETTGFVWEQYKDKTGEGAHSRAFTGWTACVILLLGLDLPKEAGDERDIPRRSAGGISTLQIAVIGLLFAVGFVFRRRLMSLALRLTRWWETRQKRGGRRGNYEEVIDLDEVDSRA